MTFRKFYTTKDRYVETRPGRMEFIRGSIEAPGLFEIDIDKFSVYDKDGKIKDPSLKPADTGEAPPAQKLKPAHSTARKQRSDRVQLRGQTKGVGRQPDEHDKKIDAERPSDVDPATASDSGDAGDTGDEPGN